MLRTFYFLLRPLLGPILRATVGGNQRAWHGLQRIRDRLLTASWPTSPLATAPDLNTLSLHPPARRRRLHPFRPPFGVNVAGYLTSEKGAGQAARSAISILRSINVPLTLNNIVDPGSQNNDNEFSEFSESNPYAFNLVYVNPDQVPHFALHKGPQYFRNHYNIGVWNWELTSFPEDWLYRFRFFDEIWAPTTFVLSALSRSSPIPIIHTPYAINAAPPPSPHVTRRRFDLPETGFLFLFIFDFHSVMERKNPLGLIEAFQRAFSRQEPAFLFIKSSRADCKSMHRIREASAGSNIVVADMVLGRYELRMLYQLCDCYVSLHRSEGFGLTPAEAMAAGKPVIATAYGGNMDFMTHHNSYLVNYELGAIRGDCPPYRDGCTWAEPSIDHAAELMRYVYEHREDATAVGSRAREEVCQILHPARVGDLMKQRLLRIATARGIATPW